MSDPVSAMTSNVQPKKHSTKSHHYCSVPGCKSSEIKDSRTSFHTFPKEGDCRVIIGDDGVDEVMDRREAWGRRTFLGKKYGKDITPALYVCSRHFEPSDYCSQG